MKIIVPTLGDLPDPKTVDYVINIAKRLGAQLIVVRVITGKDTEAQAEANISGFTQRCEIEKVPVVGVVKRGDIASVIINTAEKNSADLIILGISHGEVVAEWMNAKAMDKTDIPVLLIPKWVPAAHRLAREC